MAVLGGALALAACRGGDGAGPRPLSVTPDHGPVSAQVQVVIAGEFHAQVTTDFTGAAGSGVDARFQALLGQVPLDAVALRADGSLTATVPPGLATGSYDLTVVDPQGRQGTLSGAYRVVPDTGAGSPVASFRFDPLGPQQAMKPFAVTITALDAQGQVAAAFNGSVQLTDLTGTAVPGAAGLFAGGRWIGEVEVRAPQAADVLTASDGLGHTGQSLPFLVSPTPAAALRFLTAPRTIQAGACSGAGQPVVVGLLDAFGVPTQAAVATTLSVTAAPAGGFQVFADSGCATAAAPVVAAGASSATFWLADTLAGSVSLTASAPSLQPDSQTQTVVPGPPAAVAFVTTPQTTNAGVCSQAVTVEVRDAFGNPSPPGATSITLSASAGGFTLYSDPACSSPAAAVAVAAGATRASFWFLGTTAQLVTVTAGNAALGLASASQNEIVLPQGSATKLVILTPPRTAAAGSCSDQVTVQAQDSFGNAVAGAGAQQVTLSAPAGSGLSFFSDAACSVAVSVIQIGSGQSTGGFWFSGTVATGPAGVAVTAGSSTLTAAVQSEVVTPGPPARLDFTSAPMTVAAGACSGLATVTVRDAFGNPSPPAAALPVALAAAPPAGVTFFGDALCASPVTQVTVPAGAATATFAFTATQVGTETLIATAAGLTPASQAETVRAAAPDRLAFTSAPQSVVAGACSGAATVQARDPWGNPAPVPSATAVALSATPPAGFRFFADAACATAVTSVGIPAGQTGATFFFSGTAAGSVTVTATAAGWTPATQAEAVGPAAPDHLVFTTAPQTVAAGSCSGTVTVESRDVYQNPVPLAAGATVGLAASPAAGLAFYAGTGCAGAGTSSVAIAPATASATFSFRSTAAGNVSITASSPPLLPVTQTETVSPAAPDHLAFTTAAQTRQAGACSAVATVQSQDAWGNAAPASAATAVSLAASPGTGFAFYSDAACTTAATSASIAAGSSSASFWFKGTSAGAVTVTASATGLAPSPTQVETITAAAPDHLVFTTAAQSLTAGACSAAATVQSLDAWGNVATVAAATAVSLSASPATGFAFYSDSACTTPATSATIAAGANTASFWFSSSKTGSPTVTASAAGLSPSPTQVETIAAAGADHLAFTTAAQTRQAGACSAAATVQAQDAFGNVAAVSAATAVSLTASPATGFAFYSDSACTTAATSVSIAAGASSASFWFKGTAPGSVTVTASAAGLSPSPTQVETITAAVADHLMFATAAQTVTAGSCSGAVTVQSQDAYGNVVAVSAATAVSLGASPATGFAFYSDAGCTSAATGVTIAAGASSASFWFKGTAAGAVTVTASAAGLSPSPTQAETVSPAAPDRVAFASPPQTVTAGQCSATATVQSRDPWGNPSAVAAATAVALSASPAAGFAFYADSACTTAVTSRTIAAGASTASFWFRGTAAGSVTATATPVGLTAASQVETVTAAATPSQLVFLTAPQTLAAGACSAKLTVQSQDSFGNPQAPSGGATVSLSATPSAGLQFYAGTDPTCAGAPVTAVFIPAGGNSADFYLKATASGSVTVSAASAPLNPATQVETVNAAAANHLVFTTAAQTRQAGACSAAATVQSQDAYGNVSAVTAATAVSLAASPGTGFAFYADSACTTATTTRTIAAGASTASFWFKGTAPGSVTVTASVTGWSPSPTQVETISAAAASQLVFTTAAQTVTAGACSGAATVQSQDAYGNVSAVTAATAVSLAASPATGFGFYSDAGCTSAATGVTIAAGASTASFWFKGTAPGSVTVTASVTGWSPSPTQAETVNPAAPNHLVFTTAAQTRQAGACSAAATVQSQDAYGNVSAVTAATTVSLAASPGTGFAFYADSACTTVATTRTIAAGASTASFWFKGTAPGSVTVTASVTGWSPSPTQVETISAAAASQLVFATAAQTVTAGACSGAATVQSQDAYGNVSAVTAATAVSLAASPATGFGFYSDAGCTAAATSVSIAAGASSASFWFKGTAPGSVTVTASVTGWSPSPTQAETVNPAAPNHLVFLGTAQTLQAGACSAVATVQSQDAYGNVSAVTAATAVSLAASPGTGFAFYADSACTTAATTRTIAAGASTASFWFKGTAPGSVTVTASVAGWSPSPTQVETVTPAPPSHLVFTTAAQTVTAGACSGAATVQSQDAYGNVSAVTAATAVSLAASPATGFGFYSDAGCTAAATSASIAAGASAVSFWFKGTAAGSVTVTASAAGMTPSPTQVETVNAAPPDRLAFVTAAQSLAAGTCSAVATLQSRDPYGNVSAPAAATSAALSAAPATGFGFYSDASCTTAATSTTFAAGSSSAGFWFKGTAAGTVAATAAVAGWTLPATQSETVTAAATDHFAWDPIASPQAQGIAFAVTVRAFDAYGNPATGFTGTASLSAAPAPAAITCASACTGGTTTGAFVAGVWSGSVSVSPAVTGVRLTATSGAVTGTSGAFDVASGANRSPPTAVLTASPVVVVVGNPVTFDASGSSDLQTPSASLQVSFDFLGNAGTAPGTSPWTAWSTTQTAVNSYGSTGTYYPRVAVKDTDGDIGYASVKVVVVANAASMCVVTTSADVDDGASSCSGPYGTDGKLSLREALRVAGTLPITFSGPMTITGSGSYTVPNGITILAPKGVLLDTKALNVTGTAVISGLEMARQPGTSIYVSHSGGNLTLQDVYIHDASGMVILGPLTLIRTRIVNCLGTAGSACIRQDDPAGSYYVRYSEFRDSPGMIGINFNDCSGSVLDVYATVFSRMGTGIQMNCTALPGVRNNTFNANAVGVAYTGGGGQVLRNNIFTSHTTAAASCGGATFTNRDYHLLYQNASDGCLAADPSVIAADPLYVAPAANDYRIQFGSPARDSAIDLGLDLNGPAPGNFFGAGPDRGGRETY